MPGLGTCSSPGKTGVRRQAPPAIHYVPIRLESVQTETVPGLLRFRETQPGEFQSEDALLMIHGHGAERPNWQFEQRAFPWNYGRVEQQEIRQHHGRDIRVRRNPFGVKHREAVGGTENHFAARSPAAGLCPVHPQVVARETVRLRIVPDRLRCRIEMR